MEAAYSLPTVQKIIRVKKVRIDVYMFLCEYLGTKKRYIFYVNM